jgi:hypothetical protein
MTVTASEAVMALAVAVETWGGKRRTPPAVDLYGSDGLTGCALEVLGLRDLVPYAGRDHRAALWHVCHTAPALGEALGAQARDLLSYAQELEVAGHPWHFCLARARGKLADLMIEQVLAEETTRADVAPVTAEQVTLPDTVQVVHLARPRDDGREPCPARSPAIQLAANFAVSFGCGEVAGHADLLGSPYHAWLLTWG